MRTLSYFIIAFIAVVASLLMVSLKYGGMKSFVDLLFIVGAIIMGIGGFIAAGFSKPALRKWYGHSTKDSDRHAEIFLEHRRAQWRQGLLILIFGIALICLSVATGTFLRF
jgi:hypothetical protein